VAAWNRWRQSNPEDIPDLSKLAINTETFGDSLLWDARLEQVNLTGLDLRRANLHPIRLLGVNLREAALERADLLGATLIQVDFQKSGLGRMEEEYPCHKKKRRLTPCWRSMI